MITFALLTKQLVMRSKKYEGANRNISILYLSVLHASRGHFTPATILFKAVGELKFMHWRTVYRIFNSTGLRDEPTLLEIQDYIRNLKTELQYVERYYKAKRQKEADFSEQV